MPKSNKLPPEVVEHWPEVFEDLEIKAIPIDYLNSINIYFTDGRSWVIDIDEKYTTGSESVEDALEEFFDQYDDLIESVEFSLNAVKVKRDIQSRTKRFMKKRK